MSTLEQLTAILAADERLDDERRTALIELFAVAYAQFVIDNVAERE